MKKVRLANYEKNGKAIYTEEGIPTDLDELSGYEELEQTITNLEENKQDTLTQEQLDAVDSGITSEKVEQIETNRQKIEQLGFQYLTITLNAQNWSNNEQTIVVSTITPNSMVWVAPTPNDTINYTNAGIIATAQGNGTLTFTCNQTLSADIQVNLIINNAQNTGVIRTNNTLIINTTSDTITRSGNTLIIGGNN